MKKIIGRVTTEECKEIQALFERKNGLTELAHIITTTNDDLYERVVRDMGETTARFQKWWDTMAQKYSWESIDGGNWEIDFDTCEIFLVSRDV